ncbi:MAG: Thiamine-monophosphate kinase [Labilithrix sp.]|nr:Thiamine-monophosphate kinase [Labilithrix sp.]
MSRSTELERVALLAARFAAPGAPGVATGIGDDAAVLDPVAASLVWTIDAQVDGTHFRLDWLTWEDVGWRSFMAAASDLAAMGATPLAALSALALADGVDDDALDALARGQADAARAVGAPIVGGNLARGSETSVTTTLLGHTDRAVLRSGARAGDGIYLAGAVGMAAAGLVALESGAGNVVNANVEACVGAWRRPRALVQRGLALRGVAGAAVDVSDGLGLDAMRIAEASSVQLVLDESALRLQGGAELAAAAVLLGRDVLDLVLHGGEDYALLATSVVPLEGFVRIGTIEAAAPGVVLVRADGTRSAVDPKGFDHFR